MATVKTTKHQVPKEVWTALSTDEKTVSLLTRSGWFETTVSDSIPTGTNEDNAINAIHTKGSTKIIFGIPDGSSVYAWGVSDSVVDVDPAV